MIGMNGRRGGGLLWIPCLLVAVWVVPAVLNAAGVVIGAVFSGLAAAFSGIVSALGSVFSGIGESAVDGLAIGIALGLALYFHIRRRRKETEEG